MVVGTVTIHGFRARAVLGSTVGVTLGLGPVPARSVSLAVGAVLARAMGPASLLLSIIPS